MSRRTEQLQAAVKEYTLVHDNWAKDDSGNRDNPDESYSDAIEGLFSVFEAGEIPGDCRQLSVRVNNLRRLWEEYVDEREGGQRQYPADAFWEARQLMLAAFEKPAERPDFKPLETMQELRKQNVPDRIIARIYGLMKNDEPQPHLVQKEIDNPGSVITSDWIDPRIREWEDRQAAVESHADELVTKHKAAKKAAAGEPCPESLEDLWLQGVSVKQAARMLGKFMEEVEEAFRELDAKKQSGEALRTDETVQRIYFLADQGMTAEMIAKDVKLKPREVSKILKERPKGESEAA